MKTKILWHALVAAGVAAGAPALAQDAHPSSGAPHADSQMQRSSNQPSMQGSPSAEGQSGPDQTNAFHGGIGADGVDRNSNGTTRNAGGGHERMTHRRCRMVRRDHHHVRRCM